jgi:sugar lactone lactonase YvrE
MSATVFDDTPCALGEGPLFAHGRLFWFDILNRRLHARAAGDAAAATWSFDEMFSAAGILPDGELLLASETGLWRFSPETGARERLLAVEADNPVTRSNDGRADRQGGFWIGTMGKSAEKGAGSIWRFHRGELRRLVENVTVSNAICFAPDGRRGYYADTGTRKIMTWALDSDGWPSEEASVLADLADAGPPDGAVTDVEGALWVALWGEARALRILADGSRDAEIPLPAPQPTCPAFGDDLRTLYFTSARQGMDADALAAHPASGNVFATRVAMAGLPEPTVRLS